MTTQIFSLEGKVALVTGGSRGIGAAVARQLADQGATVALSYSSNPEKAHEVVEAIVAKGGKAVALQADQADPAQVEQLVADVVSTFGKLDILVNNAGIFETGSVVDTLDTSRFERQLAINYGGVVAGIRAASRVLPDGGRIVSMSSGLATMAGGPGLADYISTKTAIEGYTKGTARELGARGITANIIRVGSVNTDMNPEDGPFSSWQKNATPLGRFARTEEIAALVGFLASPGASFVNGAILSADGAYSA
jgi:3-oxoacyl-[acyl-carrier protein] reductase